MILDFSQNNEYYIIMASGDSNLSNNSYKHCNFKISNVESIYLIKNKNIAVIGLDIDAKIFEKVNFYSVGKDLKEFSKNIFSKLRELDVLNYNFILIESVGLDGIGLAIMNRLIRTANYNYIEK